MQLRDAIAGCNCGMQLRDAITKLSNPKNDKNSVFTIGLPV
jgi:hypothetical protein